MATDMTAEQAEQYVRERWLVFKESIYEPHEGYSIPQTRIDIGRTTFTEFKRDDALLAAAEYTRTHEQKIAEKREEIEWLIREYIETSKAMDAVERLLASDYTAVFERILALLEAQFSELLRGWRQP